MDNSLQKRNNFLTTFLSFEWKDRPKTQPSLFGGREHPPMASSGQGLFLAPCHGKTKGDNERKYLFVFHNRNLCAVKSN